VVVSLKRVLVTGGTGFIGTKLIEVLIRNGFGVVLLTRSPEKVKQTGRLRAYHCDLTDNDIKGVLSQIKNINYVIYMASDIDWNKSFDKNTLLSLNLNIRNFLEIIRNFEEQLEKVIYISSYIVYPLSSKQVWKEILDLNSINLYGAQKNIAELFLNVINHRTTIKGISLRISSVYGPGMNNSLTIPRWIDQAKSGRSITITGDISKEINYIYLDDVVDAILAALERGESGIYNIASENNVTLLQLSELIKDIIGGDVSIVLNNQFGSSSESHRQCKIDITKSIEKIGFKPKISLRDGISKLLKGD